MHAEHTDVLAPTIQTHLRQTKTLNIDSVVSNSNAVKEESKSFNLLKGGGTSNSHFFLFSSSALNQYSIKYNYVATGSTSYQNFKCIMHISKRAKCEDEQQLAHRQMAPKKAEVGSFLKMGGGL